MKNGEKYKTAEERLNAFLRFCDSNKCESCPIENCECEYDVLAAAFKWLDLEAYEEKPLPCPFCGSDEIKMAMIEDNSDGYTVEPQIYCSKCGAMHSLDWGRESELGHIVTDDMKHKLIAKWNKRV